MSKKTVTALASLALLMTGITSAGAGESTGFVRKPLARGTLAPTHLATHLPNDVVSQMITLEPGASSGWHVNPGTELVTISKGSLTVYAEKNPGCGPAQLAAGQTAAEDGRPHLMRNEGQEPVELFVSYFDVAPGTGSPTTAVEQPPSGCPAFDGPTPGFVRKPVARGTAPPLDFETDEMGDVVSQIVTIEPGASSGWHVHPSTELVTIMSGVITIYAEEHPGCAAVELPSGATATANGRPHLARNDGAETVVLLVSYFGVRPGGGGPATGVGRPGGCPDV
jgi:quercetin dioxygenase-like cupin family protein